MSKEYKIGDTLEYEGTRLKVVEDLERNCENCYFYQIENCNAESMIMSKVLGFCDDYYRSDKDYIIYVKEDLL